MSSRSEKFRLKAQDVRLKIGKGDPRLNPVWENIARSFDALAATVDECERPSVWNFEYRPKEDGGAPPSGDGEISFR